MRIQLFTGKGGVGKSTVAAGAAALAARAGHRTLVLSTDAAHSLADAYGVTAGHQPTPVAPGLSVQQVDTQLLLERSWGGVQGYLRSVLDAVGVDPLAAEELSVIPGAEEVLALLELRTQVASGRWDVVVVDCAPTGETLRLLALPEALGWYVERVLPVDKRVVRALRPVLTRTAGVPMPGDGVFDALARLHAELADVRRMLAGPEAGVRLVMTPEQVVLAEARRAWTTLSLYGYRVDGVVINRVFPAAGADAWRAGWVAAQEAVLAQTAQSFAGLPQWRAPYRAGEPVGVAALAELAEQTYGGDDPFAVPGGAAPFRVVPTADGADLRLRLPHVRRADVDLVRTGDDLVVTVGSHRRVLSLPAAVARLRVAGAGVDGDGLLVRFVGSPGATGSAGATGGAATAAPSIEPERRRVR